MYFPFQSLLRPVSAALCVAGLIALPLVATAQTTHTKRAVQRHTNVSQTKQQANAANTGDNVNTEAGVPALTSTQLMKLISEQREFLPFDLDVPGQAFVSTGPYVGVRIQFAGSDLIVNTPSVNTDIQLLDIRKNIMQQLNAMGGELFKEHYHSHLLLSGLVEGQAGYTNVGGQPSTTNITISSVSIDAFFIGPSDWTLGFVELNYDNNPPIGSPYGSTFNSSYTTSNSRIYVNKAFITIGDLAVSPWYGSLGQYYVPFGVYSNLMISDPLPRLLTRTKARALTVGYDQQDTTALFASGYIFRGDAHPASVSKVNNGGINVGYRYGINYVKGRIGGGVIGSIADSAGLQVGNGFQSYEQVSHNVPGYNFHTSFHVGDHLDFIAEYVMASTSFNVNDMSYNGHGAKPAALDLEASYSFKLVGDRPSALAIAYGHSKQALAIGMPLNRYAMTFNTSIWRNTLESIELRHDRNYAASDTANGPIGAASTVGACTAASCTSTGKSDNAITAQFDYYF